MVSLWPWRGDSNSAESFERTLSALAIKITKTTAQNDSLRQRSRKLKASLTIYGGFTYIFAFLILTLVTGWKNWGPVEYTVIAGGPLVLFGVRKLLTLWYNYRISGTQEYLDSLNKERDATIEKLKTATKYNSTQQLIDKYSKPSTPKEPSGEGKKPKSPNAKQGPTEGRVFMQPPPTANIPRGPLPQPESPALQELSSADGQLQGPLENFAPPLSPPEPSLTAEFAPNAFSGSSEYSSAPTFGESRWYDRILDALLGEDETSAKNRFALICEHCKLVNGQAPPGAKSLEDVGKWRCSACGSLNGRESEATELVKQVSEKAKLPGKTSKKPAAVEPEVKAESGKDAEGAEEAQASDDGSAESSSGEGAEPTGIDTPARSTRSKSKGKKGKKK